MHVCESYSIVRPQHIHMYGALCGADTRCLWMRPMRETWWRGPMEWATPTGENHVPNTMKVMPASKVCSLTESANTRYTQAWYACRNAHLRTYMSQYTFERLMQVTIMPRLPTFAQGPQSTLYYITCIDVPIDYWVVLHVVIVCPHIAATWVMDVALGILRFVFFFLYNKYFKWSPPPIRTVTMCNFYIPVTYEILLSALWNIPVVWMWDYRWETIRMSPFNNTVPTYR